MKTLQQRFERRPHRQQGLTAIAIVLILGMLAFLATIVIRLFPIYMEHFSVASHLESLSEESGIKKMSNAEIIGTLKKRFDIDDVSHVSEDNIFIDRNKDGSMVIAIEYEVRTPAVANVDMVVSFVDEVEIN